MHKTSEKATLVLGASPHAHRYSNKAVRKLTACGYPVVALGNRLNAIGDIQIVTGMPELKNIHTITLYLNADRQQPYEKYLLAMQPQRIIFNPGAENPQLAEKARQAGIEAIEACTLVLLSIGEY